MLKDQAVLLFPLLGGLANILDDAFAVYIQSGGGGKKKNH